MCLMRIYTCICVLYVSHITCVYPCHKRVVYHTFFNVFIRVLYVSNTNKKQKYAFHIHIDTHKHVTRITKTQTQKTYVVFVSCIKLQDLIMVIAF